MFKKTLLAIAITSSLSLSGCLSTGGESAYTVKPLEVSGGKIICCDVQVNNTKDYDKLKMKFSIKADGTISFELSESGVSASDPAMVQAENNAKLLDAVTSIIPKVK